MWLENDYIRVMVLPELVGLVGPWISGGIEFNWPQHRRPITCSPTDWRVTENADGSVSVELSEVDQMYGTKGKMTFTLYPDKAYIEIKGQRYTRTNPPARSVLS